MTTKYHLYRKYRDKTYNYIDRATKTFYEMGGGLVHVYPLIGTVDKNGNIKDIISENGIEIGDPVLNENNKRKYSHTTYELYMITNMNPPNFSWNYAGINILDTTVQEFSVHYNAMIAALGRKIIVGDVLELPWQRDMDVLGKDTAQSKFYVVTESAREESGWGPNYHFYTWKLKAKPIMDSPEFSDLFNDNNTTGGEDGFYEDSGSINGGGGLDPSASQNDQLQDQVDDILKEAEGEDGSEENGWETSGVSYRLYNEHHIMRKINDKYYITDGTEIENRPNIVGIDGIPTEKTCEEIPYGDVFPKDAQENSYFLRTDYMPPRLYKRVYDKHLFYIINVQFGDIKLYDAEIKTLSDKGYDGSILDKETLVGYIKKDKVFINGIYIGYITETGKIVANTGVIVGMIETVETVVRKGWALQQLDRREKWVGSPYRVRRAINNEEVFTNDEGEIEPMKQNMKTLVNARVKKEHGKLKRVWNKEIKQEMDEILGTDNKIIGMDYPTED